MDMGLLILVLLTVIAILVECYAALPAPVKTFWSPMTKTLCVLLTLALLALFPALPVPR
jgi:hypothetical protein